MDQRLPPPRTPRALMELFALYLPGTGLDGMLAPVDLATLDREGVFTAVLGQAGKQRMAAPVEGQYDPAFHLRAMLHGPAFRARARSLLLHAYPGKRRLLFVHIPKCAGSDLTTLLRLRYPALRQQIFGVEGVPAEKMFRELRDCVLGLRFSDTVACVGHEKLAFYQKEKLARPQDTLFTIVRQPQALLYSHVSYVLTQCEAAPRTRRPDGLRWLAALGLDEIPSGASPAMMVALGQRALRTPSLIHTNIMCRMLGDGTAETALQRIVQTDIEITDTTRYPAWRAARFPGAPATQINASTPYFTAHYATAEDRDHVAGLTHEDQKLYAVIENALARSGTLSIRGRALA